VAKIRILIISGVLFTVVALHATPLHAPFPQGCTMSTLGTILIENSPAGREPFISAVYSDTSLITGISASVTGYYDDMDNYNDKSLTTVTGGGWLFLNRIRLKAALSHFNALDLYKEFTGFISVATPLPFSLLAGVDFSATQQKLDTYAEEDFPVYHADAALSLRLPLKRLSLSASVKHIPITDDTIGGIAPPLEIDAVIHTIRHAFGAQGVRITIIPEYEYPVSVAIGQQFNITRRISIQASLANNPLFIGFGVTVGFDGADACVAMVNHPVLGWSRGFGAQYGWKHSVEK